MNDQIQHLQAQLMALYESQVTLLVGLRRRDIEDLLHQAEELQHSTTFTLRTAAEINRAACLRVLGKF